jgi:hypothetical protein
METNLIKLKPKAFCRATKACEEGAEFAAKFKTMSEVWESCPRVDWMTWIWNAIEAEHDERAERLFAVWCARNTPLGDGRVTGDLLTDPRSLAALEVAERFANGSATREELAAARDAAEDAARAAGDADWCAARAAGAAARDAQAKEFRRVIPNPFAKPRTRAK